MWVLKKDGETYLEIPFPGDVTFERKKYELEEKIRALAEEITLVSLYTPGSLDDMRQTKDFLDEKLTEFSKLSFELGQLNLVERLVRAGFELERR